MSKHKVTGDDLRAMMDSPKTLPELDTLDTSDCWGPLVDDYHLELLYRELTRLRREKILLRHWLWALLSLLEFLDDRWKDGAFYRGAKRILDKTR